MLFCSVGFLLPAASCFRFLLIRHGPSFLIDIIPNDMASCIFRVPIFERKITILLTIKHPVHYHVHIMKSKTYTEAREKLAELIETVCEDHEPCIITKRRDKAVVMMSLEDFDSLKETAYLLKSPKNARRLLESIRELEEGRGATRELEE
jgi:antitoxin YefM